MPEKHFLAGAFITMYNIMSLTFAALTNWCVFLLCPRNPTKQNVQLSFGVVGVHLQRIHLFLLLQVDLFIS